MIVLDADATLINAHSEKLQAAATFKGRYGFHPIGVWCDNTSEMLAVTLRPGNAGSNNAGDHIEVLTRAIAQIPAENRRHVLIRAEAQAPPTSCWSGSLAWARCAAGRWYSVGFPTKNKL